MAIDPNNVTTVRVGELPSNPISLTSKVPHEIGTDLNQATVQQLADVVGEYLGTTDSLAFNPTTVSDGETLPATSSKEWMLVGKGTFHNVGGGADIITTEELNAVSSNGAYWSLSVQIPVNVELAGITQNIRSGYTQTAPSEDAVFNALALKANTSDIIDSMPSATESERGFVELATPEETVTGIDNTKAVHPSGLAYTIETKTTNSAGAIQGFGLTNNGNGTVNIASGIAYLRAVNDQYAPLVKYTIPAVTNLALTDNANNYVLVDYNGGTPAITVTTNGSTINTETNSLALVISRVGNVLDWISLVGQNNDANAKIRVRFLNQEGIRRANGAVIGFINRNLTLTAGTLFSGLIRINSTAFNTSSPDTFTYVYNNGSAWTRVTGQTQVNNTQYNNAGTLTTMPNNTFRTDYVYLLPNNPSKLYVVYGNAAYANITLARNAPVPSSLPSELQVLGLLVGRQIIEKNAATISEVSSAFDNVFVGVGVPEHNALAGLQGGSANDYQHFTTAEKADILHKTGNETKTGNLNINGLLSINQEIPEATFHIGDGDAIILDRYKNGTSVASNFLGRAFNGTKLSPTAILDNQDIVFFGANPYNGIDADSAKAFLKFISNGIQSNTNRGTKAEIRITPLNSLSATKSVFYADSEKVLISDAVSGNSAPVAIGWFGKGEIPGENPHKFQVVSDGLNPTVSFGQFGGATAGNAGGHLWASRGTADSPTALLSGDYLWSWGFRGQGLTTRAPSSANMSIRATEDFTDTAHGTEILFGTNATGHNANLGRTSEFKMGADGGFYSDFIAVQSYAAGKLSSYRFDYGSNTNSRSWRIANDYDSFGDFAVIQSTTRTGTTYSKKLGISETGVVSIPNLAGTGVRQVVADANGNLSAVTSSLPYKSYVALLSQSGTSAPSAVVLENTLGGDVVWTRSSAGVYLGTLSGIFVNNKTICFVSNTPQNPDTKISATSQPPNAVQVATINGTNVLSDGLLVLSSIEIRVYP